MALTVGLLIYLGIDAAKEALENAREVGGAFQGYTLGNIMSAMWFSQALKASPQINAEMEQGKFGTLHAWLVENIYQHGAKFTAAETIQRATGGPMSIGPYIAYLWRKYQPLYGLQEHERPAAGVA